MNPILTTDERSGLPSASDAAFWGCSGKQNLWAASGYPEASGDDWSTRGDRIHLAFQTGNTLELADEEELETYQTGLQHLEQLITAFCEFYGVPRETITEGEREARFWMHDPDTLSPIVSGKLDRHWTALSYELALIVDLKTGFTPTLPPSPRNTQLRVQLGCLKHEFPSIKRARVALCKPKSKAGATDYCDYGENDIRYAEAWVLHHVWLSRQPDAPRTPGPHCGYCPCKASCPEAGAYAMLPSVVASRAVAGLQEFDVETAVAAMPPADLIKIFAASSVIGKIVDAVKARLKSMPDEQLETLGLMRGKGREIRTVSRMQDLFESLTQAGWDEAELFASMDISMTTLEKLARKYKGLSSDKAAKEWVNTTLAKYITTTTSEQPLKPIIR